MKSTKQIIRQIGEWTTLAIDPGMACSGYVAHGPAEGIMEFGRIANPDLREQILKKVRTQQLGTVVCEVPSPRGQLASTQLFSTLIWIGQLYEIIRIQHDLRWIAADRKDVMMHLCGNPRARDRNIRQALIDRFGGQIKAIGGGACQACAGRGGHGRGKQRFLCSHCSGSGKNPYGELFGFAEDAWQALGILVAHLEGGLRQKQDLTLKITREEICKAASTIGLPNNTI